MKIYLAGSISQENRTMMVNIARILRRGYGFEVYCPWELKIENAWGMRQDVWANEVFEADYKAIKDCDIFILITPGRESTSGSNFEQGLAFGLNKTIAVFQITDAPTSLMTYCGSTNFYNCSRENVHEKIWEYAQNIENCVPYNILNDDSGYCKTILT